MTTHTKTQFNFKNLMLNAKITYRLNFHSYYYFFVIITQSILLTSSAVSLMVHGPCVASSLEDGWHGVTRKGPSSPTLEETLAVMKLKHMR